MTLDDWFLSLKKTLEDAYLKHEEAGKGPAYARALLTAE